MPEVGVRPLDHALLRGGDWQLNAVHGARAVSSPDAAPSSTAQVNDLAPGRARSSAEPIHNALQESAKSTMVG